MPNNTTLYLQAGGTKGATHAGALKEQQDNGSFVQPKTCCWRDIFVEEKKYDY